MEIAKIQVGCRIPVDQKFQSYVDSTYEVFLGLARQLFPACELLTDAKVVSQLQDLYFLLKEGVLHVTEEKAQDGREFLFLEISDFKG